MQVIHQPNLGFDYILGNHTSIPIYNDSLRTLCTVYFNQLFYLNIIDKPIIAGELDEGLADSIISTYQKGLYLDNMFQCLLFQLSHFHFFYSRLRIGGTQAKAPQKQCKWPASPIWVHTTSWAAIHRCFSSSGFPWALLPLQWSPLFCSTTIVLANHDAPPVLNPILGVRF